jgi:hypothetical protein
VHADDDRDHLDVAGLTSALAAVVREVQAGARIALQLAQPSLVLDLLLLIGHDVPVHLSPQLTRLAGASAAAGLQLPDRRRGSGGHLRLLGPRDTVAEVDLCRRIGAEVHDAGDVAFTREATGQALQDLVLASGARRVFVTGAAAPAVAARLGSRGVHASPVAAGGQLPLV